MSVHIEQFQIGVIVNLLLTHSTIITKLITPSCSHRSNKNIRFNYQLLHKRLFDSILLLVSLFCLLSCNKEKFHLNMSLTPLHKGTVLDTSKIYFLNEYYILENTAVRLLEMDAKKGYKLMLASEIIKKNDLRFEIKIRPTYFSNGEPITINDVKNTLIRAKASKNSHIAFSELVDNIEVKEDVLIITLKKKVSDFLYFLTLADLSILHSSQVAKSELNAEDWEKATSGPFYYSIQGNDAYLIKNPYYSLSPRDYPDKVKLLSAKGRNTFKDFSKGKVDMGEFNLTSYDENINQLNEAKNLKVIGNNGDMINFLALNVKSKLFQNDYNRRWIQKKVVLNFKIDEKFKHVSRKAFQFFTPQVRGFAPEDSVINEVLSWKDINIETIPTDLKNGIKIHTYERAYEVSLRSVLHKLGEVLGIPVTISTSVPSVQYQTFVNKREYDVFLGITAMDQVIVGESINLYYFSSSPLFNDVNKKIAPLMNDYQSSEASDSTKILNSIALQMIKDSECIPVFYVASPFFFNKEKVNVSGLDELTYFNLWKLKQI